MPDTEFAEKVSDKRKLLNIFFDMKICSYIYTEVRLLVIPFFYTFMTFILFLYKLILV